MSCCVRYKLINWIAHLPCSAANNLLIFFPDLLIHFTCFTRLFTHAPPSPPPSKKSQRYIMYILELAWLVHLVTCSSQYRSKQTVNLFHLVEGKLLVSYTHSDNINIPGCLNFTRGSSRRGFLMVQLGSLCISQGGLSHTLYCCMENGWGRPWCLLSLPAILTSHTVHR